MPILTKEERENMKYIIGVGFNHNSEITDSILDEIIHSYMTEEHFYNFRARNLINRDEENNKQRYQISTREWLLQFNKEQEIQISHLLKNTMTQRDVKVVAKTVIKMIHQSYNRRKDLVEEIEGLFNVPRLLVPEHTETIWELLIRLISYYIEVEIVEIVGIDKEDTMIVDNEEWKIKIWEYLTMKERTEWKL